MDKFVHRSYFQYSEQTQDKDFRKPIQTGTGVRASVFVRVVMSFHIRIFSSLKCSRTHTLDYNTTMQF